MKIEKIILTLSKKEYDYIYYLLEDKYWQVHNSDRLPLMLEFIGKLKGNMSINRIEDDLN